MIVTFHNKNTLKQWLSDDYSRITDTEVKCKGDGTTSLWRRYSEFELLRNYLDITYPALVIPPLPEKKVGLFLDVGNSL